MPSPPTARALAWTARRTSWCVDEWGALCRTKSPFTRFPPLQCYYVTPVKRTFSNAVKLGAPVDRICKKLARDTPEVCQLRFPEKLDLSKTDLNKLRVRQLKAILNERGVTCDGCLEKRDYVRRVEETMHMDL